MKRIVGLTEKVVVIGEEEEKKVLAKIDTGAQRSSIDIRLASKLRLGPLLKTRVFRSAVGKEVRAVVKAKIKLKGKPIKATFSITDRKKMKYKILIGQNILKMGFLVDPSKK